MPTICTYCGSSRSVDVSWMALGRDFGLALAAAGHGLVYGGGSIGLMGEVAEGVHDGGGRVVGVMPQSLTDSEFPFADADEMILTDGMHERKAEMARRADAFAVLPGGIGTLEEMFETLTWRLLGSHDKPLVIVNADGFYDTLLAFLDELYTSRFARDRTREHYTVVPGVREAIRALPVGNTGRV